MARSFNFGIPVDAAQVFPINFAIREDSEKNCIFSPNSAFSLFSPLFQIYDETTQQFLKSMFQYEMAEEETAKSIDLYDSQLKKETKLFLRKECQLKPETKNNIENNFGCAIEWSGDNTIDPSYNLFESSSINNFINFNFGWLDSFSIQDTTREYFNKVNGEMIQTEFMNQKINCGYLDSPELNAKIVELPFSNEHLTLLVILPNDRTGISTVEAKLTNYGLQQQLARMKKRSVKICIPRIKFDSSLDLKKILKTVSVLYGIYFFSRHMFVMKLIIHRFKLQAHFGEAPYKLNTSPSSRIGGILTKSCIEISEFGSKASAASGKRQQNLLL